MSKEIKGCVVDSRVSLQEGTSRERKALIRNFVKGIETVDALAVLIYTVLMPSDGMTRESPSVLEFVLPGPLIATRSRIGGSPSALHRAHSSKGSLERPPSKTFAVQSH